LKKIFTKKWPNGGFSEHPVLLIQLILRKHHTCLSWGPFLIWFIKTSRGEIFDWGRGDLFGSSLSMEFGLLRLLIRLIGFCLGGSTCLSFMPAWISCNRFSWTLVEDVVVLFAWASKFMYRVSQKAVLLRFLAKI
jgi:hypothetical protein